MTKHAIAVGAEQFALYAPQLKNKRVGLVVNQTSLVGQTHLVDSLLAKNINITKIFAPEHGFRGGQRSGNKNKTPSLLQAQFLYCRREFTSRRF